MPPDTETIEAPATETETPEPPKPPDKKAPPASAEPESYLERVLGKKLPSVKKKEEAKAEPKAEAKKEAKKDENVPHGTIPKAKTKTAKPVQPLAPSPEPPDYTKIAEAAGRGVAEAMSKKKDEPSKPSYLTATNQREIEILERMEKLHPEESGRAREYSEALHKAHTYQVNWERKNPGQAFDKDADEHNEFFEKNDVDWDDQHFKDAEDAIREDKIASKVSEKTSRKLQDLEAKEALREAMPKVVAHQADVARHYFTELGEDYAKILDARGGIDMSEIKRLTDADPVKELAFQAAQGVEAFAGELHKLTLTDKHGASLYPFDKDNAGHQFIVRFVESEESAMQSLPATEQLDAQGRRFATAEEYNAMTPDKRRYYWRFTDKDLSNIFAAREAQRVKNAIAAEEARIEKIATARGYTKASAAKQEESESETPADDAVETPHSPAGTVEPRMAQPATGQHGSSNNGYLDRLFSRK